MSSSAQLEQEAEHTRSELAQTLDELRQRITPGQLVDQAVDYAKESGGGEFVRNLGRQMADNPLPVTLIGAGMAWLMLSSGNGSGRRSRDSAQPHARDAFGDQMNLWTSEAGDGLHKANEEVRDMGSRTATSTAARASDAKAKVGQAARDAKGRLSEGASSVSESMGSLYDSAKSNASDAYGRASDAASHAATGMADTASELGRRSIAATSDFLQFCRSQPLFIAGLGVAVGAVIGALFPSTEAEDRLMGQASDQLKDQARDVARDQYQKAADTLSHGMDRVAGEASPPKARQTVDAGTDASLVPTGAHNRVEEWTE